MDENITFPVDSLGIIQNGRDFMKGHLTFDKRAAQYLADKYEDSVFMIVPFDSSRPLELPSCRCAEPKKITDGSN